jgi:hypothetical protein
MNPENLRKYRKDKRESQFRFWSRFGVTQSRGSRFEMGVGIPSPIAILLKLYFDGIITDCDLWCANDRHSQLHTVSTVRQSRLARVDQPMAHSLDQHLLTG